MSGWMLSESEIDTSSTGNHDLVGIWISDLVDIYALISFCFLLSFSFNWEQISIKTVLKHISKYCKVSQNYLARHLGVCQYGLKRSFEFDILPALPRDETFCTSPIPVYFIIKFHFLRGPLRRLMRAAKPLTLVMRFIFLSSYDNFLGQNFGPARLKTGVGHKTQLFRKQVPALMHLA